MAKWILDEEATNKNRENKTYGGPVYMCSECENEPAVDEMNDMPWLSPYCPWCGAEMEGCGEEQDRAYAIDAEIREHRKTLADKRYDELKHAIEEDDKEKGVKRIVRKGTDIRSTVTTMALAEVKSAEIGYYVRKDGYDGMWPRKAIPALIYGHFHRSVDKCHMILKMPYDRTERPAIDEKYAEYGKTWFLFEDDPKLTNAEAEALWQ